MTRRKPPNSKRCICRNCDQPFYAGNRASHAAYCKRECKLAYYRSKRPRAPGNKRWRADEIKFLTENYRKLGGKGVSRELGRGVKGVRIKARLLGAKSSVWRASDVAHLRARFQVDGADKVADDLGFRRASVIMAASRYKVAYPPRDRVAQPTLKARVLATKYASVYGCTSSDIFSATKRIPVMLARHAVAYELRRVYLWSLGKIGANLGVDHTTALNAVRRHTQRLAQREAAE